MLTQDEYKLYTGEATNYADDDWQKLVDLASSRLASFLCLDSLPSDEGVLEPSLGLLLANFICLMLADRGKNLRVTSKKVRNFTISYDNGSAANAFAELQQNYGDIIADYSACGLGISAESDPVRCSDGCF